MSRINRLSDDEKISILQFISSDDVKDHYLDITVERLIDEIKSLDESFSLVNILARKREHILKVLQLTNTLAANIYKIVNVPGGFYFQDDITKIYFEVNKDVIPTLIEVLGDKYEECTILPGDQSKASGYIHCNDIEQFIRDIATLHEEQYKHTGRDYLTL